MKSFQEHLTESKKTYPFTVKLCGALPESVDKQMKSAMNKYVVNKLSKGKTTPIQSNPLDFPGQQNSEVHVFEVDLAYPTTSAVLTELLADKLSVSASRIRVRTPGGGACHWWWAACLVCRFSFCALEWLKAACGII